MPILKFSDRLYEIFDDIDGPVAEALMRANNNSDVVNSFSSDLVDVSSVDWNFLLTVGNNKFMVKVAKFIRSIFPGKFNENELYGFCQKYNKAKNGNSPFSATKNLGSTYTYNKKNTYSSKSYGNWSSGPSGSKGEWGSSKWDYFDEKPKENLKYDKIVVEDFKFDPSNIKSTFISLVTETYPHGHEEEVLKYLPSDLQRDEIGNYYKIIGKSTTMFTCHLDTADRQKSKVNLYTTKKGTDEFIVTGGSTILGADDKAGVTVLLHMMHHNIPGVYYFFIGEERGGIGSHALANVYSTIDHLKGLKRCVSFDRRNYYSVITEQLSRQCCSDEFGLALCKELNKTEGMKMTIDDTGIYTDSASFVDEIPECTNVSVGYFNEHTVSESQNITFLEILCKSVLNVNWEELPVSRKIGFDEYMMYKYRHFLSDFKKAVFDQDVKIETMEGKTYIKMEISEPDVKIVYEDIINISALLIRHRLDPDVVFSDNLIKIELK